MRVCVSGGGMSVYDKATFSFINNLWRCWLLQVQRVAMEGFPLGMECKPHEKSHKQVGNIFTCCVHLKAMMLFLSMDLCTFLAEVTKVSVWLTGSWRLSSHRRLSGGLVPPFESLGCFHCQEKNGNETVAGPEKRMSDSGKHSGPGGNHWSWLGPLCSWEWWT